MIPGNGRDGIEINEAGTTRNQVQHCLIGTDVSGANALPNGANGIVLGGCQGNVIGGPGVSGNLICGNKGAGVLFWSAPTIGNRVVGNRLRGNGRSFDGQQGALAERNSVGGNDAE